jgi:hypothetical protein
METAVSQVNRGVIQGDNIQQVAGPGGQIITSDTTKVLRTLITGGLITMLTAFLVLSGENNFVETSLIRLCLAPGAVLALVLSIPHRSQLEQNPI